MLFAMLLNDTGYKMSPPGRSIKRTHSLFIDYFKLCQPSDEKLKSWFKHGACYGVKDFAKVIFTRRKMVKGGLDERMKSLDLTESF